ncbi:uncharacterized protein [Watersipora subatra]|uniref:uncharacterized protein n=1 Tax=Watersipora subatra TaxID=2589382 RepID=UPI00355BA592
MTATQPDICWTVSKLSQYLNNPRKPQLEALKRLFQYIQATKHYKLTFTQSHGNLTGYCDSEWAGDEESRRSTTGYMFTLGSAPISKRTRKQSTVALSSCEAEYIALAEAVKEMIYQHEFCILLGHSIAQPPKTLIYCDNQGAIALRTKRSGQMNHTKHIDVRYHFIRERHDAEYQYIPSSDNLADILTKPLGKIQHQHLTEHWHKHCGGVLRNNALCLSEH